MNYRQESCQNVIQYIQIRALPTEPKRKKRRQFYTWSNESKVCNLAKYREIKIGDCQRRKDRVDTTQYPHIQSTFSLLIFIECLDAETSCAMLKIKMGHRF